jgi:hypothetical protein
MAAAIALTVMRRTKGNLNIYLKSKNLVILNYLIVPAKGKVILVTGSEGR